MSLEDNEAVARRIPEEVWSKGDMAAADAILSADFVNHNPAFDHAPTRDGYKQTVLQFRAGFPDFTMTIEDVLAESDRVALRARARGTHLGPFGVFPPSGRAVDFTITAICRIENSEVAELWVNGDLLGLLQQLGATITPPNDGD